MSVAQKQVKKTRTRKNDKLLADKLSESDWIFRSCPHVFVFIWKRNFLFTDTASVHKYPMTTIKLMKTELFENAPRVELFENVVFACACGQTKTELFENDGHTISSNPLRAILIETYSRWGMGASLCCFQANLGLLILRPDYSRGRQNIIRLLRYRCQEAEGWISL